MADFNQINQFGSAKPARSGEGMTCAECEAMLTDWMDAAIDGTLSPKDRAAFDLHIATCKECSQMLADAQRGAALLEMLKDPRPEPPASLMDRIIAQTSGQISGQISGNAIQIAGVLSVPTIDGVAGSTLIPVSGVGMGVVMLPGAVQGNVLPFRPRAAARFNLQAITRTMMQPRLAMTAAMAFFSIALTMNLTGVHLSELKASDLKPSNIRHNFYQANASLVRYYDNLRVVYELETRVSDLKQSNESDSPQTTDKPESKDDAGKEKSGSSDDSKRKQTPKAGSGTSQRRSPLQQEFRLADERLGQRPNRPADGDTVATLDISARSLDRVEGTNKSKELLQEGESV